jgi:protein-L-isoaspartate(D-aspartate) O-methyltransferase
MPRPPDPPPGDPIARQMKARGISDARLLAALARVDRKRFLPPDLRGEASDDRALSIGFEQTISQPYMVAVMTQHLRLRGRERVLEIGTGSGYQTAVLSLLAREVYTVERIRTLSLRARGVLDGMGVTNVRFRVGDGTLGWPEEAPFDGILVTAGAPALPNSLVAQLREGGRLVVPVGDENGQELTVAVKRGDRAVLRSVLPCRFVKLIGQEGWSESGDG